MNNKFPGKYRLKTKREFEHVSKVGKKCHAKNFLVLVAPSEKPHPRVGLTVSKKVDDRATVRNRIRRQLREIFRLHRTEFKAPYDIVIIARRAAQECSYAEIERQVLGALRYNRFLQ